MLKEVQIVMSVLNKILAIILVPLFINPTSPLSMIAKIVYAEKAVVSLSENGIGNEADPVYLTAHRGVTNVAPENTIPAYEAAVELGYYTAECDIRLTKDNEWVLMHNSDVQSYFFAVGEVSDYTLDELKEFKYRRGVNFWDESLTIPTLEEYLDVFVGTETRPQIEIKADGYEMLYTVVDAVEEKELVEEAIVISFDLEQLKVIHELNPDIELWYLIDEITPETINEAKAIGDNVWLSPDYEDNNAESIQLAIDAGVNVSFWTVNSLEDAKMLYDMGIRYIETDVFCN